ncbi:glycosyltransferase [Microbacterium sp. NPDC058021]|uniref:glycosyltransferase n=1 Tax=Microbacterium sp. NPDC058021 TaxID=3346306 RepID=UPI0036DB5AE6
MTPPPPVSLVLTVLNEARTIPSFLASVREQTSVPTEIVVVDGGSTDDTVAILRKWTPPGGCTMSVVSAPGAGISEGRNRAVRAAAHDIVLVTDGGTVLEPRWVERMRAAFDRETEPTVVGGFFRPVGAAFMERAIACTGTPRREEVSEATFLPSSRSFAFTKNAWESAGGYPEWLDYCEDLVFDLRLKERGNTFAFVPDAVVTWSARSSLPGFMKQYYRYARGDGKAGLWPKRHAVRYAAYATGLALTGASFAQPWVLVPLVVGFAAYTSKFVRRVFARRDQFGALTPLALGLAPVIVVAGDIAKMAGYPVGVRWRARRHPAESEV